MKYLQISTIDELKKVYRKLCQLNHPDNGGNVVIMSETYPGTERNKAIARYNELCKQYPKAEHAKSIDKSRLEK